MIKELKKEIANVLKVNVKDIKKIYLEKVKQGFETPSMYVSLITQPRTFTVANIDYMKAFTLDIHYFANENTLKFDSSIDEVVNQLDSIKEFSFNGFDISFNAVDIQVVDKVLHYVIELNVPLKEKEEIETSNEFFKRLQTILKEVSKKDVFYLRGKLEKLKNSFFVIEPTSVESNTIAFNGITELERSISIRYVSSTEEDVPTFLEETMLELIKKIRSNKIFNVQFDIDIEYIKEEYNELNLMTYNINLSLTERK